MQDPTHNSGQSEVQESEPEKEKREEQTSPVAAPASPTVASATTKRTPRGGIDWLAVGVVGIIALLFAFATRLSGQPSTALLPSAVLSATGCGLLVTAIRKLRTTVRPGLLEAALGGLSLALCQLLAALSYPGVLATLSSTAILRQAFLSTWGIVVVCAILFSGVGAALGHLAFAPLRPLPASQTAPISSETVKEEDNEEDEDEDNDEIQAESEEDEDELAAPARSLASYVISVALLALAPIVAGYLFSAAYDLMFTAYQFEPGPYPTLRLLSGMLPWQIPLAFDLNQPDAGALIFTMLWRIPLFLGNAGIFDIQALEPYVYNGVALALLLLIMPRQLDRSSRSDTGLRWGLFLVLEALLGLILVIAPALWIWQGLEGLLQIPRLDFAIPLRTLRILDPLTFFLNLASGPVLCLLFGVLLRKLYERSERPETRQA